MKINYSSLKCPHCGAKEIHLLYDDVFSCEYCGQKFNFSIDELEINAENKIFIDELKEKFSAEVKNLNKQKTYNHNYLLAAKKLAYPKRLLTLSLISLILSLMILFGLLFSAETVPLYVILFILFSLSIFIFAKIRSKIKYNIFKPYITFYATEIVDIDTKINAYDKWLSKLSL